MVVEDTVNAFIEAASVPRGTWHVSGRLDEANAILTRHPHVACASIYSAAVLGDASAVRAFLGENPRLATTKGGPREWDALLYLCFSNYLRLDPARSEGFEDAARALLEAGADAATGWIEHFDPGRPEWECALYGAAGIAHHPGVTALLLRYGADPNDGEVTYHTPETYENRALELLVETGKLTPESLAVMLVRKADWHDLAGIRYLLEHGADPNFVTPWGCTALQHALERDNDLANIQAMLEHGADPAVTSRDGVSGTAVAARQGRGDVLSEMIRRGLPLGLTGVDALIASCTMAEASAGALAAANPDDLRRMLDESGALLSRFACAGNAAGVRCLLDLGAPVDALYAEGDPYYDIAPGSRALHFAAWRIRPEVVKLLLARGADVNAVDSRGRSALALAVKGCVDSYWSARRTPEAVRVLLDAGASVAGAGYPCGYDEVDALLRARPSPSLSGALDGNGRLHDSQWR